MLDEGLIPRDAAAFVLEEKIGPVRILIEAGESPLIWLRTPPITYGPTRDRETCAAAVGLRHDDLRHVPPQLVSARRGRHARAVLRVRLRGRRRPARTRACSGPTSACSRIRRPAARRGRSRRRTASCTSQSTETPSRWVATSRPSPTDSSPCSDRWRPCSRLPRRCGSCTSCHSRPLRADRIGRGHTGTVAPVLHPTAVIATMREK